MTDRTHLAYCDQCGDEILEGDVHRAEREWEKVFGLPDIDIGLPTLPTFAVSLPFPSIEIALPDLPTLPTLPSLPGPIGSWSTETSHVAICTRYTCERCIAGEVRQ